jgi:signal peptidase I
MRPQPRFSSFWRVVDAQASRWERIGSVLLWYVLPAFALLAVAGYIALTVAWHANPPVVPVVGTSMRPALHAGDLVFVKGAEPGKLKKGDVIAFRVSKEQQNKYSLPATYVHRIVRVEKGSTGDQYRTKGDNVSGQDPFWVFEQDVVGKMVARGPGLGYPILFFRSKQGRIFLAATAAVFLLYVLMGIFERRRDFSELNALNLAQIVSEARELKESMEETVTSARGPPDAVVHPTVEHAAVEPAEPDLSSLPPERRALHLAEYQLAPAYREELGPEPEKIFSTALVPYVPPIQGGIDFAKLEEEIHRAVSSSEDVKETMRELVGAIGEYGEHLRSHTDVMKNIAASTGELQAATAEMRTVLLALAQAVERLADRQTPDLPQ